MHLGRLNHVGVVTPSIERSLELYRNMFGAEPHGKPFDLPAQGVRVCFVDTPNSQIELIEPLGENSPIARFLEKNPLGGQHHVCFEVADIHAAKAELEGKGARVLGEPRISADGNHGEPKVMSSWKFVAGLALLGLAMPALAAEPVLKARPASVALTLKTGTSRLAEQSFVYVPKNITVPDPLVV